MLLRPVDFLSTFILSKQLPEIAHVSLVPSFVKWDVRYLSVTSLSSASISYDKVCCDWVPIFGSGYETQFSYDVIVGKSILTGFALSLISDWIPTMNEKYRKLQGTSNVHCYCKPEMLLVIWFMSRQVYAPYFSDIFRRSRKGTLAWDGLNLYHLPRRGTFFTSPWNVSKSIKFLITQVLII